MTEDQIKEAVTTYILNLYEDDNADCLHEVDGLEGEDLSVAYDYYRRASVTVTF